MAAWRALATVIEDALLALTAASVDNPAGKPTDVAAPALDMIRDAIGWLETVKTTGSLPPRDDSLSCVPYAWGRVALRD